MAKPSLWKLTRWSEREGRAAIAAWMASALSSAEFCRRKGMAPGRLSYWQTKLELGDQRRVAAIMHEGDSAPGSRIIEFLAAALGPGMGQQSVELRVGEPTALEQRQNVDEIRNRVDAKQPAIADECKPDGEAFGAHVIARKHPVFFAREQ